MSRCLMGPSTCQPPVQGPLAYACLTPSSPITQAPHRQRYGARNFHRPVPVPASLGHTVAPRDRYRNGVPAAEHSASSSGGRQEPPGNSSAASNLANLASTESKGRGAGAVGSGASRPRQGETSDHRTQQHAHQPPQRTGRMQPLKTQQRETDGSRTSRTARAGNTAAPAGNSGQAGASSKNSNTSSKNEDQIAQLMAGLQQLREQQRAGQAPPDEEDEFDEFEDAVEGIDWVWWKVEPASDKENPGSSSIP